MNADWECRSAWLGRSGLRPLVGACLALAALVGCGAPDQAAVAPPTVVPAATLAVAASTPILPSAVVSPATSAKASPTPFPTFTLETPFPTAAAETPATIVTPVATPTETPTPLPVPTIELPPTPSLPVGRAFEQLVGDVLLYADGHGFLMLTDGSRTLWVTSDDTLCDRETRVWRQHGEWSPDGRFLAFTCAYAGVSAVMILDTQTGALKRVDAGATATNLDLAWPHAWSPNAAEFLIIAESDGVWEIFLVDAITARLKRRLLDLGNLWSAVAWSPDRDRIAILRIISHGTTPLPGIRPGLYIIDADGANLRAIADVSVDGAILHSLDWSRDGASIIVDESIADGLWATLVSPDTAGGVLEPITDTLRVPTTFRWSPDGRHYLVKEWLLDTGDSTPSAVSATPAPVERRPHWSLYRTDGRLVRRYSSDPNRWVIDVAWMPDGRQIMMLATGADGAAEVIAANIDGQERVAAQFPNATIGMTAPGRIAVAPGGELLAIALDASRIVILNPQGGVRAELVGEIYGWRPRS
jgi:Tol biopolymer transport system component